MVSFYHVSPGQGEDGAQGGNVGVSSVDFSYTTLFQLCENKMMLFFFFCYKNKKEKKNEHSRRPHSHGHVSRYQKKAEHKRMQYQRRV